MKTPANMKITREHYALMRDTIFEFVSSIPKERIDAYRASLATDPRVKDLAKRFRWDLLWQAKLGPFVCSDIYKYANDEHIDTALRLIVIELGL